MVVKTKWKKTSQKATCGNTALNENSRQFLNVKIKILHWNILLRKRKLFFFKKFEMSI